MWFSAMLAEEYKLIDISLISFSSGWTNKAEQQNINTKCINLTQHRFGLKDQRISAQQKALTVGCNVIGSRFIIKTQTLVAQYINHLDRRPHIFLSHSSKDKEFVRQLANDLLVCEVDVWFDEWEIEAGDSIYKSIANGIETSIYVALIISKSFLESKWASEETESAFSKQMENDAKVILPLMIEKVEVPALLKGKLYIPFYDNYFHSLTKLSAIVHKIRPATISNAIINKNPTSMKEVADTLAYCGFDPYMIIPKDVFEEIAKTGKVEIFGNRMRFNNNGPLLLKDTSLSGRAKNYLYRLWPGEVIRDIWGIP